MAGIFPDKHADLAVAVGTVANQIGQVAAPLGLAEAEVKAIKALCGNIAGAIASEAQKRSEWRAAAQAVQDVKETDLVALRKKIAHLKTSPGWTPAMAQTLGVGSQASPEETSPATLDSLKPRVRLVKQADRVEIRFVRGKLDGVNIYSRKKGEATWRFLDRVRHSPAFDSAPPSTPGQPEVREYRIQAVFKNREVGLPSDILTATVGE